LNQITEWGERKKGKKGRALNPTTGRVGKKKNFPFFDGKGKGGKEARRQLSWSRERKRKPT